VTNTDEGNFRIENGEIGVMEGGCDAPLGSSASRIVPLVVASALFMDLMDSAALATALPTLAQVFHTDPVNLKLALTAYLLTIAVLVPASGWLSNRYGAKAVFMTAMGVFVLGSICCGLSNSVPQMVIARVLQGLGGSMMTPVGRSIVVASTPRPHLVQAMAWFTIPAILGPLVGPPLAGVILENGSWRWIFLINVPVGISGIIAVLWFVPATAALSDKAFDFLGFFLLGAAITAFMALVETAALAGEALPIRLFAVASALAAFATYCRYSVRRENPIIDLRLLRRDTLLVSLLASWLQRMPMGAMPFLLPLLLQVGMDLSALRASEVMIAMACGGLISRFIAPPLIGRLGFRWSMLIFGAATALLSASPAMFRAGTPVVAMMVAMGLTSMIRSAFFIPAATLAYADVIEDEVGQASVLFTVAQQLSLAMGVTMAAELLKVSMAHAGPMVPERFVLPFLAMAGIGGLSLPIVWMMRNSAGEALRNRRPAPPSG